MEDNTRFLAAMLKQDRHLFSDLVANFERQGKGTPVAIIGMAFDVAIKHRFRGVRDRASVIRFVADTRSFYPDGEAIDVQIAEGLIFATLDMDEPGVDDIIDNADLNIIAETEGRLLFKVVHDQRMSDDEIDAFLTDVEARSAAWQPDTQ